MVDDYLAISTFALVPNRSVEFDVHVWNEPLGRAVPFLKKGQSADRRILEEVVDRTPDQSCLVRREDADTLWHYIEGLSSEIDQLETTKLQKIAVLVERIRIAFTSSLATGHLSQWVDRSIELSESFDALNLETRDNKEVIQSLLQDGSFASHSFNTGVYAYLIAKNLGAEPTDAVDSMVGGWLHDAGKLRKHHIHDDLYVAPPGLLELASTESVPHTTEGLLRLSWHTSMRYSPLMAVYQHHERMDGRGGPVGLCRDDLSYVTRICAVANRWDGLLSHRIGRRRFTRVAASGLLDTEIGTFWDKEAVKCLLELTKHNSNRS
jgi:HD-GYP domain-containing protein (c-di-GMP phosphodiesterase class II)